VHWSVQNSPPRSRKNKPGGEGDTPEKKIKKRGLFVKGPPQPAHRQKKVSEVRKIRGLNEGWHWAKMGPPQPGPFAIA